MFGRRRGGDRSIMLRGRRNPRQRQSSCTVMRCAALIGVVLFAMLALNVMREWGVPRTKLVALIAAPEGVEAVRSEFPETEIVVAAFDQCLNEQSFIVPGLGDAGDRQFNTLK